MEPISLGYEQLLKDLLELGFNQNYIGKALQLTNDKEKAVELILKFQEEEEQFNLQSVLEHSKKDQNPQNLAQPNQTNPISSNIDVKQPKENEEDWYFPKNDYKMVILVRSDLKMGVGKIAAQVGHAVLGAYKNVLAQKNPKNLEALDFWEDYGQAKVVLKVNSKEELIELEAKAKAVGLNTCVICDAGRTQIEAGSMTVCAIGPAEKTLIDSVTKHLKLL